MTKEKLIELYKSNIDKFTEEVKRLDGQLWNNSLIRIGIFVLMAAVIYFFWSWGNPLLAVFFGGMALFLFFVKRHLKLKYQRDFAFELLTRNEIELNAQHKDFSELSTGLEFNDGQHEYCNDIDLFGLGSFFQYANRTSLVNGPKNLANLLKSNDIGNVSSKQEAVSELSDKNEWRQQFWAEAQLVMLENTPEKIIHWTRNYVSVIPPVLKLVVYGFSLISIVVLFLFIVGFIPEGILLIWFLVGLTISGAFVKKINNLSTNSSKSLTTFQQYSKLLERIEQETWESDRNKAQFELLEHDEGRASHEIGKFAAALNALDQRSNIFIAVFTNGLFLRDIFCAIRVESWIAKNQENIQKWFDVIDYFDVQNTLGNFHFNHPSYKFPIITDKEICVLEAKKLGHPLLQENKRVDNDFTIKDESFFIITGANMAGKSTFLRTVSLAIVMGNSGLPICSNESTYRPIKLVSSMRTTDSLSNDESYFFSELKRLRYIIDKIEKDRYFIILDEILKGTNSVDKAAGSKKFVQRLVKSHSTGIIATHDLSLCETADEFEEVENHYFDAQILDDELYFDYQFKVGICQNMNASFLLKKMDIV